MDASVNGDYLDEFLVQVLDGSVISVRLSEGFSESIRNDLQEFLNRQVNLFHLPPNTTGDTDVSLRAFVPQGRTSASGSHFRVPYRFYALEEYTTGHGTEVPPRVAYQRKSFIPSACLLRMLTAPV